MVPALLHRAAADLREPFYEFLFASDASTGENYRDGGGFGVCTRPVAPDELPLVLREWQCADRWRFRDQELDELRSTLVRAHALPPWEPDREVFEEALRHVLPPQSTEGQTGMAKSQSKKAKRELRNLVAGEQVVESALQRCHEDIRRKPLLRKVKVLRKYIRGALASLDDTSVSQVLPDRPSLPASLLDGDQWTTQPYGRFEHCEHITILEARTALLNVQVLGRAARPKYPQMGYGRVLMMVGNEAVVGALNKGRSSRPGINAIARRVCSLGLATSSTIGWVYIITAATPADEPSRRPPR